VVLGLAVNVRFVRAHGESLAVYNLGIDASTYDERALQLAKTRVRASVSGVVSKKSVEVGQLVQPGQPLMALVPLRGIWVVANFKETQVARIRAGQRATIRVDTFPDRVFHGAVDSISAGTGARFSLLPPENASGNWVKVVQRIPVKIVLDRYDANPHLLRPGMSATVTVDLE